MSLDAVFNAKSIAVVGGSEKPGTLGRALMENLLFGGYKGRVYAVNIRGDTVFGHPVFRRVTDIPDEVELAVIVVPARVVPNVLRDCAAKGVKAAIIISAGFSETGKEGRRLEQEVVSIARKAGIRIIGPNCLGVYNAHNRLDTIFNPSDRQGKPKPGSIAFISQSGALGAAILDWFSLVGLGMSKFVSYGNAADVDEADLVEYLAEDPQTRVICMYIEGVRNGPRFVEAARRAARKKPIIALKAGRTPRGAAAVTSHTGSLAGEDRIYDAAFQRSGIIRARTLEDLFAKAKALSLQPPAPGDRIAIVTNGGGAGVIATDAVEALGLKMADLSPETQRILQQKLPPHASWRNPVDVIGDAPVERYDAAIRAVMQDPQVDAVLVIFLFQSPALDAPRAVEMLDAMNREFTKPLIACTPGGEHAAKHARLMEERGIPVYSTPEEAVLAIEGLVRYGIILRKLAGSQ